MPAGLSYFGRHTAVPGLGSLMMRPLTRPASRAAGWGALAAGVGLTGATGASLAIGGAALYEARHTSRQWQRGMEAAHMSRILATAQEGPFGTGRRPYGMGPNFSNSAGMSLAMHYARNGTGIKNPFFSLGGLGGRGGQVAGTFLGNM